MLRFIYALVFSLFSGFAHAQYQGTTFNVASEINGTGAITGIFLNTTTSAPSPGTWIAVDITTLGLPANTVALNLGGFLIITNGNNTGTSDLTIAFRAYGDTNISCGGEVRVGILRDAIGAWKAGDAISISGSQPSSMNANGTFTVASTSSPGNTYLCLAGSTFGTGTWTSGTGVINGGVSYGPNYAFNVGTGSTTTQANPASFTPIGNGVSCPQATNCPSIESYDLSIGGDGTLADFVAKAKANRKGAWDLRYTAPLANNYIRVWTDTSIPRPSL